MNKSPGITSNPLTIRWRDWTGTGGGFAAGMAGGFGVEYAIMPEDVFYYVQDIGFKSFNSLFYILAQRNIIDIACHLNYIRINCHVFLLFTNIEVETRGTNCIKGIPK
jgi:hypothetical protein